MKQSSELIILVHGTGAADPGKPGEEKWWQSGSVFSNELLRRVLATDGQISTVPEALDWGGANSEYARRAGGRKLARQLDAYEKAGIGYHLIGHSHGGSVIWHALKTPRSDGSERRGPESWITVGTPYLQFVPRSWTYVAVALALLLASTLLLIPFFGVVQSFRADFVILERDMPMWSSVVVAAGPLVVLIAFVAALVGLGRYWRTSRAERSLTVKDPKLMAHLREVYLPLWHGLDEPLSGLSASLSPPPPLSPRAPIKIRGWSVRSWFARLYNRCIPPLVDAFVWSVLTGRLQGRDIPGLVMRSCAALPAGMTTVANGLPPDVQEDMSKGADDLASDAAQRLRVALRELGDGRTELKALGQAISWQEVLHTAYFSHAKLAEICSLHISKAKRMPVVTASPASSQKASEDRRDDDRSWPPYLKRIVSGACRLVWARLGSGSGKAHPLSAAPPSQTVDGVTSRYYEPRSLYLLFGFATALLLLIVIGASRAVWESFGLPLTSRYQIERIVENAQKPEFGRLWESPAVGLLAARLAALDMLEDPDRLLQGIDNPNTQVRTAQLLAYAYGFLGNQVDLRRLRSGEALASVAAQPRLDRYLSVFAMAGAVDSGNAAAEPLAAEVLANLAADGLMSFMGEAAEFDTWFVPLLQTRQRAELLKLMATWPCDEIRYVSDRDAMSPEILPHLAQQKARCGIALNPAETSIAAGRDVVAPSQKQLRDSFAQRAPMQHADYKVSSQIAEEMMAALDADRDRVARFLEGSGDFFLRTLFERLPDKHIVRLVRAFDAPAERVSLRQRLVEQLAANEVNNIENEELHSLGAALGRSKRLVELRDGLGQSNLIDRVVVRLGSHEEPTYRTIIGNIYLACGDTKKGVEQLWQSFNMKASVHAFANAMWIAELASRHDRDLAVKASDAGMLLIGSALRVSTVGDPPQSVDDAVSVLARVGEYKRARDLAESVGRPLSSFPSVEAEQSTPEFEKLGLQGAGVLGSYVIILDAWIEKTGSDAARRLIARKAEWPPTFNMVTTVFNRG